MNMKTKQITWETCCNVPDTHSAMTVEVVFSHSARAYDATEFCINYWDTQELRELFAAFCAENDFTDVAIQYVRVIRTASSLDELTQMEEQL